MPGIDDIGRIRETLDAIRSNIATKPRQVWYVDGTNGHANYDGLSRLSAFSTINAAISAASAGDAIHIAEDTYDEAISIPAGLTGLQIYCERGVYLINTTPGTVVAIAATCVRWEGGIIEQNGQTGMEVNGQWFYGKNIQAYNCNIGFDMNAKFPLLINCRANLPGAAGFDISEESGYYLDCICIGQAGARGFYLSHMNALNNMLLRCVTENCTAAGYETVALANGNMFKDCSHSSLCGGPIDAGGNNTWASHSEDSQIAAGNTLQDDLGTIEGLVDDLESRLTAARAGYLDELAAANIPADIDELKTSKGRVLCCMDFWSLPQEEVALTNVAGDKSLPDVTVADLPSGATIVRAIAMFKFRMVEETSSGVNKLNGAQEIQVRDDTPSAWIDAINFVDDQFTLAADAREGGDVVIGAIDVSATVDGNDTYNFQWDEALADADGINFNDVQVGLRIWYSI